MRKAISSQPGCYFILLPASGLFAYAGMTDCASHLVDAIYNQARGATDWPVDVLVLDLDRRSIRYLDGRRLASSIFCARKRVNVLVNIGFMLADPPPFHQLVQQAEQHGIACCGNRGSREIRGFAFKESAISDDLFWQALTYLTACDGDDVMGCWAQLVQLPFVPSARTFAENSPALAGIAAIWTRRSFDSPVYLNTAIKELLSAPRDGGPVQSDPMRMAEALLAQRDVSLVPWIFNCLANDIEYRLGHRQPQSYPQELHLSITGACNLECRFCGYTHDVARQHHVEPQQVARLDFLRHIRALRLHSGLGEPTLNPYLSEIIGYASETYPHLEMNFSTNAVALDRFGTIAALVGRVRWINASLNAASRDCWRKLCGSDQFERVCGNLKELHQEKRARASLWPLVFGSMVLTRENLTELPRMPSLCRQLGIDRLTVFPYFGLGYSQADKFGPEMALESFREQYDELYFKTIREAEDHSVSLELPPPRNKKKIAFGLEVRAFYDFARIEENSFSLVRFTNSLRFSRPAGEYCRSLWCSAGVESTNNSGHDRGTSHFLYPCLGPLSSLDLSRSTAFHFPGGKEFKVLWNNEIFAHLRAAQHDRGVNVVCDLCRGHDTRDPATFPLFEKLVGDFSRNIRNLKKGRSDMWLSTEKDPDLGYGAKYLEHNIPESLPGQTVWGGWIRLENSGSKIWQFHHPEGRRVDLVIYCDGKVLSTHSMPEPEVRPGEKVVIHFPLHVPIEIGAHEFLFDLVEQNVTTFSEKKVPPLKLRLVSKLPEPDNSEDLYARASRSSPWYYQPTRGVARSGDGRSFPLFVSKAEGCHLWNQEGRRFIDYIMGWGSALLGYAEPRVQRAVREACDSAAVVPFPHSLEVDVAEMLIEDIPGAEMVVFGKNGSDVCTLAIRLARVLTGKEVILYSGYHGWQDWWVEQMDFSRTGVPNRHEPIIYRFKFNDLNDFERLFKEHRQNLAGVMLEPAGAVEGIQGPIEDADCSFLQSIARITRKAGALLIYDEIITGFRYLSGSVQKATGVVPDLSCFGKALSAGMPLSVLVGRADLMQRGMENTHYGPTFKGEVYSLAAAKVALGIYREEPVAEHVWEYGTLLKNGLNRICREVGIAAACIGPPFRVLMAFDEENPHTLSLKRTLYQQELLKAGVITYNGFMLPSYAHDRQIMDVTLAAVGEALAKVKLAESRNKFHRYLDIPLL